MKTTQNIDPKALQAKAGEVADILSALANDRRLLILCKLVEVGEATVGNLAAEVGLSQSALSRRISKTAAWFVAMVVTVVAMSFGFFLGVGDFIWFLPIAIVTGLGIGADYGLPPSILADVINSEEGKDTQGDTGAYFGLWALSTKLATAIGAAGSLPVAAVLGFNPSSGQYDTSALVFVYIAVPVLIKIAAALLIWFIRIEAERGSVRDEFRAARA